MFDLLFHVTVILNSKEVREPNRKPADRTRLFKAWIEWNYNCLQQSLSKIWKYKNLKRFKPPVSQKDSSAVQTSPVSSSLASEPNRKYSRFSFFDMFL